MKSLNDRTGKGPWVCLVPCSYSIDKETEPGAIALLTQSLTTVGGSQCRCTHRLSALSMLALMKFGKLTGSREQVPCKDKKAKGPFSKSPPFWVLALIQQDDCCSSCSSICAIVHQIERGTYSGPQNETHVHHIISQFLGEPVFISVVAQVWELKGTLKVIRIAQWLSNYLVCLFVHFFFKEI